MAGHKPEEYKGVAKFFTFLSNPDLQAWYHQVSGYLPITHAAYELTKQQGFYEKNPGTDISTDISIRQMTNKPPTSNSKGMGTHGGGIPEGRVRVLAELGIAAGVALIHASLVPPRIINDRGFKLITSW